MFQPEGRIVLASGGTAGHVYPAIPVAEELRARGVGVLFALPEPAFEDVVAAAGFETVVIPGGPWALQGVATRARTALTAASSLARAFDLLGRCKAAAVLGFGSYGSIAPVVAAKLRGIPSAILEPNAVAGMASRVLAPHVATIYAARFTEFPDAERGKLRRVGMPVRAAVLSVRRSPASGAVRVLVVGDTRGPAFLDERVPPLLARLGQQVGLSVCHLAGRERLDDVAARYRGVAARVEPMSKEIDRHFAGADFVVTRSGASTLAELAVLGMPSLLVPLASSAGDHQRRNAEVFARQGAALVRSEDGWDESAVVGALRPLLSGAPLSAMGAAAARLGVRDATERLVDDLFGLAARRC